METAQAQKEELSEQVESKQAENDALRADIADGGSQEKKEEIARDELGMVAPGERVFYCELKWCRATRGSGELLPLAPASRLFCQSFRAGSRRKK